MRPGVKALIVHQGKILIVRENVPKDGKIVEVTDFPGGGIDFGEGLKDALVREVKEEVGLAISVGKVVGAWDFVTGGTLHESPEEHGVHIVCIGYQCEVIGDASIDTSKNPADEDIFEANWYSKEEILADSSKLLWRQEMIEAVRNLEI